MKTDYDKMENRSLNLGGSIPLKQEDIIAAYKSQDRDARLLGEYWALNLRIRGLEHMLKLKKKQREGKAYSPEPLMIMQVKAMKKYANALAIRLDYEQGGRANPEVIARIKAMHREVAATAGNADVAEPIVLDEESAKNFKEFVSTVVEGTIPPPPAEMGNYIVLKPAVQAEDDARIKAKAPKGEPAIVLTPEAEEYLDKALGEEE